MNDITIGSYRFSREEAVMLFVFGVIHGLVNKGVVTQGQHRMSARGLALFDQLKASGFRPTDDEFKAATLIIKRENGVDLTSFGHHCAKEIGP